MPNPPGNLPPNQVGKGQEIGLKWNFFGGKVSGEAAWVKEVLERLKKAGGKEQERGFVTHRTMADLRYTDPNVDPNDRPANVCVIGDPESANSGPAGFARYSTLRSWLSQWSIDDCNVNGAAAASSIRVPLLVMENSADEACPPSDEAVRPMGVEVLQDLLQNRR